MIGEPNLWVGRGRITFASILREQSCLDFRGHKAGSLS